jgi:hypothetical protein
MFKLPAAHRCDCCVTTGNIIDLPLVTVPLTP